MMEWTIPIKPKKITLEKGTLVAKCSEPDERTFLWIKVLDGLEKNRSVRIPKAYIKFVKKAFTKDSSGNPITIITIKHMKDNI